MPISAKHKNIVIQALLWSGMGVTIFLLLMPVLPLKYAFFRAISILLMISFVHYCNRYIVQRTLVKNDWQGYLIRAFFLLIGLSIARYFLETFVFPVETQPFYFRQNTFRPLFFMVSAGVVCFISSLILYLIHLSQKEKLLLQTINAQNEARLQHLQSQINPHFLFNALNNIYSLVLTQSNKAPGMLLHLTELLRYSVYQKQRDKVLVYDEAQQIEFLIELFCLRRDEDYNISFEKNLSPATVEPMVLIPLAENCLKHCDFDLNDKAYAKMHLECTSNYLHFKTENTFNNLQKNTAHGGVGLQNIYERLHLIYGKYFNLTTNQSDLIYTVELRIEWKQ